MVVLIIILTIVGLVLGAALDGVSGLVGLGLLGFLLGLVIRQGSRLSLLEKDFKSLQDRLSGQAGVAPAATPAVGVAVATPTKPSSETQPVRRDHSYEETLGYAAADVKSSTGPSAEPHSLEAADFTYETETGVVRPTPPPLPAKTTSSMDNLLEKARGFLTTANVVLGSGIIILFFGVSFLLKYAVEHDLLPLELRYIGAGLLGIVLMAIGWRLRFKRRSYALLVQGAAVGVLYITVFSAARWHGLVPLSLAFALMVALVILSGLLSVLEDARGLAAYAAVGGFLAPVLTSTGGGHHVMLFSYYALLSAGILGIAFFKTWRELNLIGFVFTLGIGSAWGFEYYRPELFSSTEPFLILFFLMYLAVAILYASRQAPNLKGLVDGTLVFGLPVVAFTLQSGLVEHFQYGLAVSALVVGSIYIILTAMLWRYRPEYMGLLTEAFLALGVVFGSLAIPLALDGQWTGAIWALEGAALVWLGLRQDRIMARCFGQLLQLAAGAAFILDYDGLGNGLPFLNGDFLSFFIISLGGLLAGYHLWARRERMLAWERHFHWVFLFWGLIWWFAGSLGQIDIFVASPYQTSAVLVWFSLSALIMGGLYHRLPWGALLYPMFGLLPILLLICLSQMDDGFYRHPFHHLGYLAWPLALFTQYYLLRRHEEGLHRVVRRLEHLFTLWLAVFLAAWESAWLLDHLVAGGQVWSFVAGGVVPALAAQALLTWGRRLAWPFEKYWADYSGLGLLVLLAEIVLWLVIGSLTQAGQPRPLPYLPILNPLELTQLYALQVLLVAYLRFRRGLFQWPVFRSGAVPASILAAVCFIVANGILARAVHFYGHLPFSLEALSSSMTFQAGLSIFWTITALSVMAVATARARRPAWFAGAGLLGLVVIKLFLVDLSNTGTIARIISFIVVGILMLLIGYLSPLPPQAVPKSEEPKA
jgi:uncharacterized membrane protein